MGLPTFFYFGRFAQRAACDWDATGLLKALPMRTACCCQLQAPLPPCLPPPTRLQVMAHTAQRVAWTDMVVNMMVVKAWSKQ